jgi:hypothetical protein
LHGYETRPVPCQHLGMNDDPPPPEAYGRVTNSERFRPLHSAADDLLRDLEVTYRVERIEGEADLDPELGTNGDRVVRLIPEPNDAAPLTIAYSDFPSLYVRYGQWGARLHPA